MLLLSLVKWILHNMGPLKKELTIKSITFFNWHLTFCLCVPLRQNVANKSIITWWNWQKLIEVSRENVNETLRTIQSGRVTRGAIWLDRVNMWQEVWSPADTRWFISQLEKERKEGGQMRSGGERFRSTLVCFYNLTSDLWALVL